MLLALALLYELSRSTGEAVKSVTLGPQRWSAPPGHRWGATAGPARWAGLFGPEQDDDNADS